MLFITTILASSRIVLNEDSLRKLLQNTTQTTFNFIIKAPEKLSAVLEIIQSSPIIFDIESITFQFKGLFSLDSLVNFLSNPNGLPNLHTIKILGIPDDFTAELIMGTIVNPHCARVLLEDSDPFTEKEAKSLSPFCNQLHHVTLTLVEDASISPDTNMWSNLRDCASLISTLKTYSFPEEPSEETNSATDSSENKED